MKQIEKHLGMFLFIILSTLFSSQIYAETVNPLFNYKDYFESIDGLMNFCKTKVPKEDKDECYFWAVTAKEKPQMEECNIIKERMYKQMCLIGVAFKNDAPELCEKVHTLDAQMICYAFLSKKLNDKSICSKIQDPSKRILCEAYFDTNENATADDETIKNKQFDPGFIGFHVLDIEPNDDIMESGKTYTFITSMDTAEELPNLNYEYKFSDGYTAKTSSDSISRSFDKPGNYILTVRLFQGTEYLATTQENFVIAKKEKTAAKESPFTPQECTAMGKSCAEECNLICEDTKGQYCDKYGYSGCALDVFCWCNVCAIYDTKWCPNYPGYLSCAEGIKGQYRGCIDGCQAKREGGQDVSTCWQDCNKIFEDGIIDCKQQPCREFCRNEGFKHGEWARYTNEYGWDSCYCSND